MNSALLWRAGALCSLVWVTTVLPAWAQSTPRWEAGLGAALLDIPQYRGADRRSQLVLPLPYVVYRGDVIKADREGARAVFFESRQTEINLSAQLSPPLDSNDNPARAGMPRLAPTAELGPSMQWRLHAPVGSGVLSLHWPLRAVFTLERQTRLVGWQSTPHLQWASASVLPGWRVSAQTGPILASRAYHAYYYDVDATQATPDRPAYQARGGYGGWQVLTAASTRWDQLWFGAFVRAESLQGAIYADSPLVWQRSAVTAGVAMAWVFARSSESVLVKP
ncbi:MAG: MipA/OmpV family protein [Burkholderiales bacterium]